MDFILSSASCLLLKNPSLHLFTPAYNRSRSGTMQGIFQLQKSNMQCLKSCKKRAANPSAACLAACALSLAGLTLSMQVWPKLNNCLHTCILYMQPYILAGSVFEEVVYMYTFPQHCVEVNHGRYELSVSLFENCIYVTFAYKELCINKCSFCTTISQPGGWRIDLCYFPVTEVAHKAISEDMNLAVKMFGCSLVRGCCTRRNEMYFMLKCKAQQSSPISLTNYGICLFFQLNLQKRVGLAIRSEGSTMH